MRRNMHPLSIGKNVLKGMVDDLILQMRLRSLQTVTISINTSLLQGTGLKMPEGAIQQKANRIQQQETVDIIGEVFSEESS